MLTIKFFRVCFYCVSFSSEVCKYLMKFSLVCRKKTGKEREKKFTHCKEKRNMLTF